jgi:hypothetical protein
MADNNIGEVYELLRRQEKDARDRHDTLLIRLGEVEGKIENCNGCKATEAISSALNEHVKDEKLKDLVKDMGKAIAGGAAALLGSKYL